jgi:hypothetical protein
MWQVSVGILVASLIVGGGLVAAVAGGASARATSSATAPVRDKPSKTERDTARELRALADAWREGGGHYGYPFWEKAYERWKAKGITASVFREYVTGYRDNLQLGCELMETVDVDHDASRDVRDLVLDACRSRVEALRAQKRELDARVKYATAPVTALDADQRADLAGEIAEQHSILTDKLQQSWRDTRMAMDRAQSQLDESGLERLAEDAII